MCGFMFDMGSDLSMEEFQAAAMLLKHRGPDSTRTVCHDGRIKFAFHRLAIMDTSNAGDQPFFDEEGYCYAVCNGEIYNYRELREALSQMHCFQSASDCEVLIPLYHRYGVSGMLDRLDGEFAFALYDAAQKRFMAARDPIGIRPLFYGFETRSKCLLFASEAKALHSVCRNVYPFPPGHYCDNGEFVQYCDPGETIPVVVRGEQAAQAGIRNHLTEAVVKRLNAKAPVGFLLSGGLDSSLVSAIARRALDRPISTFAVGLHEGPIDIKYAHQVAQYINSDHHEVYFSVEDALALLDPLIYQLETWDVTTVRASIGMYFVCQYVRERTTIRVLLTGEVSDELLGYKYTDFAPSPEEFQREAQKRVRELYMYDVLRADRCIAAHGLESRVPFSDTDYVRFVMSIDPVLKMNKRGIGKWLLRQAFAETRLLPEAVLWREKAAFSDAVGHSLVDELKAFAEAKYSDTEFEQKRRKYRHCPPLSKEALLYREIFEHHYPDRAQWVADHWLPNRNWVNCDVGDPSARVLPNYGLSGT